MLIYTPVRAHMACELRWRNIREDKGYIEYLPKRRDSKPAYGSSPKHESFGWKYLSYHYLVVLTDDLRAIIEAQREQQIREDIEIKPDGFVFIHGRARTGAGCWTGKCSSHRTLTDYLRDAVDHLRAKGETVPGIVPEGKTAATIRRLPRPVHQMGDRAWLWRRSLNLSLAQPHHSRHPPEQNQLALLLRRGPARRSHSQDDEALGATLPHLCHPTDNVVRFPLISIKEVNRCVSLT